MIENFSVDGVPIRAVTPDQAVAVYTAEKAEAEEAVWYVLHTKNKALGHTTDRFRKSDRVSVLFEIAFRDVPKLMENYFYRPLGLELAPCAMTGRRRVA